MRQANNTIKGYLYQFNKSILEILNADEDAYITLEGVIEDIDIQLSGSTTIQLNIMKIKDIRFRELQLLS